MTKQWLIRRSVRMPVSRAITAAISSSVCRLPFISAPALPSRTRATAFAAELWLCADSTIGRSAMSNPYRAATSRMRAGGPTRIGSIRPSLRASIAPPSDTSSQGCATAVVTGGSFFAARSGADTYRARADEHAEVGILIVHVRCTMLHHGARRIDLDQMQCPWRNSV